MSLALRLSIAMILLVVVTTAGTGMLIYKRANDASRPVVFESLKARAGILADGLTDYVAGSREDVMMLADLPAVQATAELKRTGGTIDGRNYAAWRAQLAAEMLAVIKAKHSYAQVRLIGLDDDGRELVRVERDRLTGTTRIVPNNELQSKGERNYYRDAVTLPAGTLYVSQVSYNRERGEIELPAWPTVRLATAIRDGNDRALGIVIINVDLKELFTELPKGGFKGGSVYLVDENGYYLISPNPDQAFAFEYGNGSTFQSDWPGMANLVNTPTPVAGRITDADGRELAMSAWPIELGERRHLTLIESIPTDIVFRGAATVARSATMTGAVAVVLAGLLAIAIAATLTDPLRAITKAVGAASKGKPVKLPVNASGEPGALARAVSRYLERDSLLNAIVGTSVDSIVTVDMNGFITTWNPAAERLYGYTADEAIGQDVSMLTPVDRRAELEELMERISRNESIDVFETVKLTKTGEPIDVYNHGDMRRDFTYVTDLVAAIRLLVDAVPGEAPVGEMDSLSPVAPHRVVNIGNSQPVQLGDMIAAIEDALGIKAKRNFMPMQPGDVPATWADAELLRSLTGYVPGTDIREGVRRFVAWYRDYYQI